MTWGLIFIGPIKLVGRYIGDKYVLIVIDYATKWVETRALRTNAKTISTQCIYEFIFIRFGCLLTLVNDQLMK
jgi:hypothetical protein